MQIFYSYLQVIKCSNVAKVQCISTIGKIRFGLISNCHSWTFPHNIVYCPKSIVLTVVYFEIAVLCVSKPVFTAETAGWARDFPVRQGKFSQESLCLFQENLTRHGGKRPGQTVN